MKIKSILKNGLLNIFINEGLHYYQNLKDDNWEKHLEIMKKSFIDSVHYWEDCFLERIENQFSFQDKKQKLAFRSVSQAIDIISLLTPFLAMTLHQVAKNFGRIYNGKPSTEAIGLLILDEAGQICPETGFFSLLLSKRALVIGDNMQLEPIHSISVNEDNKLLQGKSIKAVFRSSIGNLMDLADISADYRICLLEHYRCHPHIISISNELCYQNKLIPKTFNKQCLYPALSFLDVYGVCSKHSSGSLNN